LLRAKPAGCRLGSLAPDILGFDLALTSRSQERPKQGAVADAQHRQILIKYVESLPALGARALYNLACFYASAGNVKHARELLEQAVVTTWEARAHKVEMAIKDPSLSALFRAYPDLKSVLETRRPRASRDMHWGSRQPS
jgi:hypothetical protein